MRAESLCVFCGSSIGQDPAYRDAAVELGAEMARRGQRLIYGGGRVGIMGVVADAVLAGGGRVTGIIPEHLNSVEVGHAGATELQVVANMHERKKRMSDLADAFVVLPGGLGTLDETFEAITWKQLGLHDKPIVIADIGGYWRTLVQLVDEIVAAGFARPSATGLFLRAGSVREMFTLLEAAPQPATATDTEHM